MKRGAASEEVHAPRITWLGNHPSGLSQHLGRGVVAQPDLGRLNPLFQLAKPAAEAAVREENGHSSRSTAACMPLCPVVTGLKGEGSNRAPEKTWPGACSWSYASNRLVLLSRERRSSHAN
jgi:hypothetical protein